MKLLLDTHALLWALAEPEKLSDLAHQALLDPETEVWVSSVSLFEIATKVRVGKLTNAGPLLQNWEWTLARLNARLLTLSGSQAVLAGGMGVPHRDPFDRLLAAQALDCRLMLVSCDQTFGQFADLTVLW